MFIRPVSARYMHQRQVKYFEKETSRLSSDTEAEDFVANSSLTEYDLSEMVSTLFEPKPKDKSVNPRLSEPLLDAVRTRANLAGLPYQRFIRMAIERALQNPK